MTEIGFDSAPPPEPEPSQIPPAGSVTSEPAPPAARPVTPGEVRQYMKLAGGMAEGMIGREDGHWQFTDAELDMIVPGVVSYINSRPQLQQMVARGETGTAVLGALGYMWRNAGIEIAYREEVRSEEEAARRREEAADDPVTWSTAEPLDEPADLQQPSDVNAGRWPPRPAGSEA